MTMHDGVMHDTSIHKPTRWDVPFSAELPGQERGIPDRDIDRILGSPQLSKLLKGSYKPRRPLRDFIRNDARLVYRKQWEIIVREGDWGNSAFFILRGSVKLNLNEPLPPQSQGMTATTRRTLFQAVAQFWRRHRNPEVRDAATLIQQRDLSADRRQAGERRIFLQDTPVVLHDGPNTASLQSGDFFGEQSALGRTPRSATVVAADEGPTELLEIRWQGLRDLMSRCDEFRQDIEAAFRRRALDILVRKMPIFKHLPDREIDRLREEAELRMFGRFDKADTPKELARQGSESGFQSEEFIEREGGDPKRVTFIYSGLARLTRQHHHGEQTVSYLLPGQMFGLEELVAGWKAGKPAPYRYSLRAIGYVTVVSVAKPLMEELVFNRLWQEKAAAQPSDLPVDVPQDVGGRVDSGLLEFLSERRFVGGTATMVIDMNRCTRCDDCVQACATTHENNPRFKRQGPVYDRYMVANACLHCQDPVCMIGCETGAIHRNPLGGQVVINDETCVGCRSCYNNCPFDAIRMVEARDGNGVPIRDDTSRLPILKATKCDLCADQMQTAAPACQTACPHDALQRVDLTDVTSLAECLSR